MENIGFATNYNNCSYTGYNTLSQPNYLTQNTNITTNTNINLKQNSNTVSNPITSDNVYIMKFAVNPNILPHIQNSIYPKTNNRNPLIQREKKKY